MKTLTGAALVAVIGLSMPASAGATAFPPDIDYTPAVNPFVVDDTAGETFRVRDCRVMRTIQAMQFRQSSPVATQGREVVVRQLKCGKRGMRRMRVEHGPWITLDPPLVSR